MRPRFDLKVLDEVEKLMADGMSKSKACEKLKTSPVTYNLYRKPKSAGKRGKYAKKPTMTEITAIPGITQNRVWAFFGTQSAVREMVETLS